VSVSLLPALLVLLAACGAGDEEGSTANRAHAQKAQSSPGVIAPASSPYRVVAVTNGGSITGHVLTDGALPADTNAATPKDPSVCGAAVADGSLVHRGDSLGNVVVWIRDARQGRALPTERRLEIVHDRCVITPRVLTAVVGSTVNVRNLDPMVYRMTAERDGVRDTVTIFRMSDPGQVVPSERLARRAGLVKLDCDQNEWARGWIAVFDHPYYAITREDGSFRIDSLPPGRYHLEAWHERAVKPVEREIEVRAGEDAAVEVRIGLK
jgi:hypothetical protein